MKRIIFMLSMMFLFEQQLFAVELSATAGEVKFTAIGKPGFLKIRGESKGSAPVGNLKIKDDKANGEFEFDLKNLDTGIELRNEHMKNKYLEVEKFPKAKLVLESLSINEKNLSSNMDKDFSGKLTLHGVTKSINGKFQYEAKAKKVKASFSLAVSDFKIDVPKHLGVTVSETVEVEVTMSMK